MTLAGWLHVTTDASQVEPARGRRSLPRGFPDHLFLRKRDGITQAVLVEAKRPNGKLSVYQTTYHQLLRSYGIDVHTVYTVEGIEELCKTLK